MTIVTTAAELSPQPAAKVPPPSAADTLNAAALGEMRQMNYENATRILRQALRLDPKNVHARNNLASCMKQLGREDEAIAMYEAIIADEPQFLYALNNLAFSYLRKQRYAEAWNLYHHRRAAHIKVATVKNPLTGKPFLGEPLPDVRGKAVLLVLEQGIGDELFFLRFLPRLLDLGPAEVWYAPGVKAYPLIAKMGLPVRLTDSSFALAPEKNAVAIPLADLPLLTGHDGTWFPRSPELPGYEYAVREKGVVGVAWRAGDESLLHQGGTSKKCPPTMLGAALKGVVGRVVVMQRNPTAEELAEFRDAYGGPFEVYRRDQWPAAEMLALADRLASLDDYIGVSNTDMYLLAAMGRTARTLVIHPAEWRWLGPQVPESPWFPGFRRYHADIFGWQDALERLRADLLAG